MVWVWIVLGIVLAVVAFYAGHRTLDPVEIKPRKEGAPRFRGSSLGLIEEIYNPAMEYVMEERGSERARGSQDDSGDGDPEGTGAEDTES